MLGRFIAEAPKQDAGMLKVHLSEAIQTVSKLLGEGCLIVCLLDCLFVCLFV